MLKAVTLVLGLLGDASARFIRNDAGRAKPNPTLHLHTPLLNATLPEEFTWANVHGTNFLTEIKN